MVVALKMALESSVLHLPSETERALFQTTRWSCSWQSSALLVKWVKDAATTPVRSSEMTPFVPEREQNTSRSA